MYNLLYFIFIYAFSSIKADSLYDPLGQYLSEIQDNRRMYDTLRGNQGRVDANGSIYNSFGKYLGKIEANGHTYDSLGGYKGRIDAYGNIYMILLENIELSLREMEFFMIQLENIKKE